MNSQPFTSPKSWLKSATVRNAFLALVVSISTVAGDYVQSGEFQQEYFLAVAGSLYAFVKTIEGRANAEEPIYTPAFLPGPNKPVDAE